MKIHTNLNLTLIDDRSIDEQVDIEYYKIVKKHNLFNSPHELFGVLCEEFDEFWDSIKRNDPDPQELIQIAAIAKAGLKYLSLKANEEVAALQNKTHTEGEF
jgi:hypothetical protein